MTFPTRLTPSGGPAPLDQPPTNLLPVQETDCPPGTRRENGICVPDGQTAMTDSVSTEPIQIVPIGGSPGTDPPDTPPAPCPAGQTWNANLGACVPTISNPSGDPIGDPIGIDPPPSTDPPDTPPACPPGQVWSATANACVVAIWPDEPPSTGLCPPGQVWDAGSQSCITPDCPPGYIWGSTGCIPYNEQPPTCPEGQVWNGSACVEPAVTNLCPPGYTWDISSQSCLPPGNNPCGPGYDYINGRCIDTGNSGSNDPPPGAVLPGDQANPLPDPMGAIGQGFLTPFAPIRSMLAQGQGYVPSTIGQQPPPMPEWPPTGSSPPYAYPVGTGPELPPIRPPGSIESQTFTAAPPPGGTPRLPTANIYNPVESELYQPVQPQTGRHLRTQSEVMALLSQLLGRRYV